MSTRLSFGQGLVRNLARRTHDVPALMFGHTRRNNQWVASSTLPYPAARCSPINTSVETLQPSHERFGRCVIRYQDPPVQVSKRAHPHAFRSNLGGRLERSSPLISQSCAGLIRASLCASQRIFALTFIGKPVTAPAAKEPAHEIKRHDASTAAGTWASEVSPRTAEARRNAVKPHALDPGFRMGPFTKLIANPEFHRSQRSSLAAKVANLRLAPSPTQSTPARAPCRGGLVDVDQLLWPRRGDLAVHAESLRPTRGERQGSTRRSAAVPVLLFSLRG